MIKDLVDGSSGQSIFLIASKSTGTTKKGSRYANVEIQDTSGKLSGKVWDLDSEEDFAAGNFVRANYSAGVYNGSLQITLSQISIVPEDQVNLDNFKVSSKYAIESIMSGIDKILSSIEDEWLNRLVGVIREDSSLMEAFKVAPGAVKVHHAYRCGLAEHTYFVMKNVAMLAKTYKTVNRDLAVVAAFCHDFGKIQEIEGSLVYSYGEYGIAMGHVTISAIMINNYVGRIEGFPENTKRELLHAILAHHGLKEFGSPVLPATPEAMLVHYSDMIDSKLAIIDEYYEQSSEGFCYLLDTTPLKRSNDKE